jgi:hypothetical protein
MSFKTPAGSHFEQFRKLALTTAMSTSCSPAWTNELAKPTVDEWFHLVRTFVPGEVRETLNVPTCPSFEAIQRLPFFSNDHGVYADTPKTEDDKYIYPWCCTPPDPKAPQDQP